MQFMQDGMPLRQTCGNIQYALIAGTAKTQGQRSFVQQKRAVYQDIQFIEQSLFFRIGADLIVGIAAERGQIVAAYAKLPCQQKQRSGLTERLSSAEGDSARDGIFSTSARIQARDTSRPPEKPCVSGL